MTSQFSNRAEMLSGPVTFFPSRVASNLRTSSSLISEKWKTVGTKFSLVGTVAGDVGGLLKWWRNSFTMSEEAVNVLSNTLK